MSRSEDLVGLLRSDGESAIDQLINDREAESLFLDFKRATTNSTSRGLESSDRASLAKAISGFGNSSGGVLVWGVECEHTPTQKLPIDNAERFRSLVENAISGCTLPPHTEVENHVILSTSKLDRGFVVTHVPKSNSAPHQALPSRLYYIRAGSNFVPATHDTIAGLFGRRPQPKIGVNFFLRSANRILQPGTIRLDFIVNLLNQGSSPVGDVFLNIELWGLKGGSQIATNSLGTTDNWTIEGPGGANLSLVSRDPYRLAPRIPVDLIRIRISFKEPFQSEFTMKLIYGAEGAPITIRENTVTAHDLQQLFNRFYHASEIDREQFLPSLLPEFFH